MSTHSWLWLHVTQFPSEQQVSCKHLRVCFFQQPRIINAIISPLAMAADFCSLAIRPTSTATTFINIAEIELFDTRASKIAAGRVTLSISSVLPGFVATFCNDGSSTSICHSLDPASGDPTPTLHAFYPCTGGRSGLSKVVVVNRQDCCRERLDQFTLDFLTPAGTPDWPSSFTFTGARATHTIAVGGECVHGLCGCVFAQRSGSSFSMMLWLPGSGTQACRTILMSLSYSDASKHLRHPVTVSLVGTSHPSLKWHAHTLQFDHLFTG
jgi:hypothetical protein